MDLLEPGGLAREGELLGDAASVLINRIAAIPDMPGDIERSEGRHAHTTGAQREGGLHLPRRGPIGG